MGLTPVERCSGILVGDVHCQHGVCHKQCYFGKWGPAVHTQAHTHIHTHCCYCCFSGPLTLVVFLSVACEMRGRIREIKTN